MLERLCLSLTLPLLLGAAQDDLPTKWQELAPKDAGFKVSMPGESTMTKKKVGTSTGFLDVCIWVADGKNESAFVVSSCDFPESDLKKGAIEKRLDQASDGAESSSGGKIKTQRAITLADGKKKHPGRDLVIVKNGKPIAHARIFVVERRLYQVMVLGAAPAKDTRTFLDSFRLNK